MSSDNTNTSVNTYSYKRYFINNLDSYQGAYFLNEVIKIVAEKNAIDSKVDSTTVMGEDVEVKTPPPPPQPYEIIGTVTDTKIKSLENVAKIVPKAECLPHMLGSGNVIFDISCDRDELKIAKDYLTLLNKLLEKQSKADGDQEEGLNKRYLVLISTVMTWSSTKPLDPDNPEMPFIETDFRKRKCHPNYKTYYDIENDVVTVARKYRSRIGAIVVTAGLVYGGKEDVLYYWFQKAWEAEKLLPLLGRGLNIIPLINILDLAQIVSNLIRDFPKKLYILAVEQNITKQREIVKGLGRIVGSGMFRCIPPTDAFLISNITQRIFDLITLNMSMEPTFIVETMGLQFVSEAPFTENVPELMKQFKKERELKPFKVVVYGPPLVGKTTLAKRIAEAYGLIYVSPETVVQDLIADLTFRLEHFQRGELADLGPPPTGEEEVPVLDDEDDPGEEEGALDAVRQTLAILTSGRPLSEEEIMTYMRQRLLCREAQNRGWVLDGYINSMTQCAALFDKGEERDAEDVEEDEDEQFEEDVGLYSNVLKKMLPDIVVSLEATDEFICDKAMRQPETVSRLDEEAVLKRLNEFRTSDARDITPLNFFDELDIHPLVVPVKDHTDYCMNEPYAAAALRMGRPCRYEKLMAIIEAAEKREREEMESLRAKQDKAMEELEKKIKEDREEKMEYWSDLYSVLREEEEAALAAAGVPMRNYLVHHIFPTLTPALLEVAKLRPDDPIDFLAEYLFKLNPSGKMLEPGYNLQAEKLLGKIKILDKALYDLDIKIDPLLNPDAEDAGPAPKTINPMSAL